jgi:hypothetical protein
VIGLNPVITKALSSLGRAVVRELAIQTIKHGPEIASKAIAYGRKAIKTIRAKKIIK